VSVPLARLEKIIDRSGAAARIEAMLPAGARRRQLSVRTLLVGMLLAQDAGQPAHLTRAHAALTSLPPADQERLGVVHDREHGPRRLTYRQAGHTFRLITSALSKDKPDGTPSAALQAVSGLVLEASIPDEHKNASSSLAVDWTDVETWSRPPPRGTTACADPEAHWGHRSANLPGPTGEMFYGYYLSAAVMTGDEHGPPVPELARRMTLSSCGRDPVRALVPVLTRMPADGIALGDIIADSGYAHRDASAWAVPLRLAGADLVQDLHPHDRGPRGTCHGAIIANGNTYCPQTPRPLLGLAPLPRGATAAETAAHDAQTAEAARYKLAPHTGDDIDGYHRAICPAAAGKIRCPLRPESMTLGSDRPEILTPPEHPPACCTQQTITIPPHAGAKTRQKHDYPSAAWRRSYARRTSAERAFATIKDTATSNVARGWCRQTGLVALTLWTMCLLAARNLRILGTWQARQAENASRAARGLPARTRQRRRTTLSSLAASPP
jgi:hypothetical protein